MKCTPPEATSQTHSFIREHSKACVSLKLQEDRIGCILPAFCTQWFTDAANGAADYANGFAINAL
jgi:hypothetical protein